MLYKVEVLNDQDDVLISLSLRDPSEGYIVKDIDGLDPVKATLVSSNFASMDGEQYQSSRREKRNIILKLDLKQEYTGLTTRELRTRLYGPFMPKTAVRMRFYVEGIDPLDIVGRVESFDAPLFVKDPQVTISILCFQPDFYEPNSVIVNGNTTGSTDEILINYEGSVDTGIVLRMETGRSMSGINVYHRPADNSLNTMVFIDSLIAGDILKISTVSGDKYATRGRSSAWDSVLYGISPSSAWFKLSPGPNYIRVYATGAAVPYTIEYTNKHGGL